MGGGKPYIVDIGAGTGNLSKMLLERSCKLVSVEPNDAMREEGKKFINSPDITWVKAVGDETNLDSGVFDGVTFGSSFNVLDRDLAIKEAHRLLKDKGYFACMWNHRDLSDPIQNRVEDIIEDFVPNYDRGTRREDQKPFLLKYKDLFTNILYVEEDFDFFQTKENYINAWKSVSNKYWDLETKEGIDLFNKIFDKVKSSLPDDFNIRYTTRLWIANRV